MRIENNTGNRVSVACKWRTERLPAAHTPKLNAGIATHSQFRSVRTESETRYRVIAICNVGTKSLPRCYVPCLNSRTIARRQFRAIGTESNTLSIEGNNIWQAN